MWTWTATCTDTKLVPGWRKSDHSAETAIDLMDDLQSLLDHRVQLATDGLRSYLKAVEGAFGGDIDYAQPIKKHGGETGLEGREKKYSPADWTGIEKRPFEGNPNDDHISTSYVERNNLTIRMSMHRFTRLTNAFSKKVEDHARGVALHFMHYNFCRKHMTQKTTPATAASVADRIYELDDIVRVVDKAASKLGPRGPYRPRNSN